MTNVSGRMCYKMCADLCFKFIAAIEKVRTKNPQSLIHKGHYQKPQHYVAIRMSNKAVTESINHVKERIKMCGYLCELG